jgi:hypothetical protein
MSEPSKYKKGKHIYTKWSHGKIKEVRTMSEENSQKQVQIQIEIDDTTAQGVYSNLATISHSETEFTLDFIYVQPQQPKAKLRARIISSPVQTKKLLQALVDNVNKYEQQFGEIKIPIAIDRKVGFGNA